MKLKELRSRIGLTQKKLAEQMDTTQQTVARWETGKTTLKVDQIRDLCVILECTAEELLGWETDPSEFRTSPFSAVGSELPFGTLQIKMPGIDLEYPIGEETRSSLMSQMDEFRALSCRDASGWFLAGTLNNKLLLINPAHLMKLRLVSDDVEAMPSFENAEIYRALEDWPNASVTGRTRKICDEVASRLGGEDDVSRFVSEVCIIYRDGSVEECNLSEDTATEWHAVMMAARSLGRHCFAQIHEDGHSDATFANLECMALVEIPSNLFFRLTSD